MKLLDFNYAKDLKALVFDLDEKSCKQILFAFIEVLTRHPSVSKDLFVEIVSDGRDYHKAREAVKR